MVSKLLTKNQVQDKETSGHLTNEFRRCMRLPPNCVTIERPLTSYIGIERQPVCLFALFVCLFVHLLYFTIFYLSFGVYPQETMLSRRLLQRDHRRSFPHASGTCTRAAWEHFESGSWKLRIHLGRCKTVRTVSVWQQDIALTCL